MFKKVAAILLLSLSLSSATVVHAKLPGINKLRRGVKKVMAVSVAVLVAALVADPAIRLATELANPLFWKRNLETRGATGTIEVAAVRVLGVSALTYLLLNAFEFVI